MFIIRTPTHIEYNIFVCQGHFVVLFYIHQSIVDINTGYIRDGNGLENLFKRGNEAGLIYTEEDFTAYGNIIKQLKQHVMDSFELTELYFTAPTFITRLDGRSSWQPQEIHDEYWHVHSDMNNTQHYHYSGLLYMSTFETDFTGL